MVPSHTHPLLYWAEGTLLDSRNMCLALGPAARTNQEAWLLCTSAQKMVFPKSKHLNWFLRYTNAFDTTPSPQQPHERGRGLPSFVGGMLDNKVFTLALPTPRRIRVPARGVQNDTKGWTPCKTNQRGDATFRNQDTHTILPRSMQQDCHITLHSG